MSRLTVSYRGAVMLADATVIVGAFLLAGYLRFGPDWYMVWHELIPRTGVSLAAYGVAAVAVLWLLGVYREDVPLGFVAELRVLFKAGLGLLLFTLSVLYFFKLEDVSRLFLALFFGLSAAGMVAVRLLRRWLMGRRNVDPVRRRHLVVVGSGEEAREVVDRLAGWPGLGVSTVGYVADSPAVLDGLPRLGGLEDLPRVLHSHVVDDVAVCLPPSEWHKIDAIAATCAVQGKTVRFPLRVGGFGVAAGELERVGDLTFLTFTNTPTRRLALAAKRVLDVVGSALVLLVLSPLLVVTAAAIRLVDGPPVLFRQDRAGLGGRVFRCYKFRTMTPDAEQRKAELLSRNERRGPAFKVTDDPRVTRLGRFLRKWSIDELPQLFNVLRGDMSLVGPRPQPVPEAQAYDFWHRRRLSVKPGITGLWQISSRNDPDFDRWVKLDLEYIDNWSLWLDLKILAQTPLALVRMPGS